MYYVVKILQKFVISSAKLSIDYGYFCSCGKRFLFFGGANSSRQELEFSVWVGGFRCFAEKSGGNPALKV